MRKIKYYSIRKNYILAILKKTFLSTFFMLLFIFLIDFFGINQLATNILGKIPKDQLLEKANKISFDGTIWPLREVTDLSYRSIKNSNMTYKQIRQTSWDKIPDSLKTYFPKKIFSYIHKYQNITLQQAPSVFTDPDEYNRFTFLRRLIRTTWTAGYNYKNIWKKDTGTHAGVDFISSVGTPLYSIANGLVIEKKKGDKGFGNFIAILIKVDGKYYVVFYGHMNDFNDNIKVGDFVKKGDFIGTMGNSGNSSGPHLHLQINKVFELQDIISGRIGLGWYHSLDGVKAYTIDPISFIEKYYNYAGDDLSNIKKHITTSNKKIFTGEKQVNIVKQDSKNGISYKNIKVNDNENLISTISKVLEKQVNYEDVHAAASEKAYIKKIDLKLIDNKIQVGHAFTVSLSVKPGSGLISILSSNENLQFFQDKIENPYKERYDIQFLAKAIGNTIITFNDGRSLHSYNIEIYKKDTDKIYGIKVITDNNCNLLGDSKISIYPTNKFGQIINNNLRGNFKIYLDINNNKKLLQNVQINSSKYVGYIRANMYGKGKLIVESDKFYSKINITCNIAKDYSYDSKYANSMFKLIKKGIIKGENGYLYPNRKITRRELLTIIGRSIFHANYDSLKLEMNNYIKKHGRFFKYISGKDYSDPYVYLAWKEKIIKGKDNYSLVNTYVSKGELLIIFTRLFNIKTQEDPLNIWTDLKSGMELKSIADTIKKYGLYPLENYNTFNAGKLLTRIVTFETLDRFLNFKGDNYISVNTEKEKLEKEINKLFEF